MMIKKQGVFFGSGYSPDPCISAVEIDGEYWFPWHQIFSHLRIEDHKKVVDAIAPSEKKEIYMNTQFGGKPKKVIVISKSELNNVVNITGTQKSERFLQWIDSEVIPEMEKKYGQAVKEEI